MKTGTVLALALGSVVYALGDLVEAWAFRSCEASTHLSFIGPLLMLIVWVGVIGVLLGRRSDLTE